MIHYRKQLTECPLHRERVGAGHNFWEIKRGSHLNLPLLAGGHFVIVFYVRLFSSPPPVQEWKIIVCPRYHCSVSSVYNVYQPPHILSKIEILKNFDSCGAESVACDKVPIKQSRDKRGRK